jgi:hypothetical protein
MLARISLEFLFDLLIIFKKTAMDFLTPVFSAFSSINFQLIFQLTCLALIVVSGPVIIFLLSANSGDL